jgi:hypothetical protein
VLSTKSQKEIAMGLLKTAIIGAAVYGAIKYVTKKDVNGKSIVDDLKENAPKWAEEAKRIKDDFIAERKIYDEPTY